MDKMREEFEKWAEAKYAIDESRYGGYISESTQHAWQAWQASRQALVVQLPHESPYYGIVGSEIKRALDDAGIKWTE